MFCTMLNFLNLVLCTCLLHILPAVIIPRTHAYCNVPLSLPNYTLSWYNLAFVNTLDVCYLLLLGSYPIIQHLANLQYPAVLYSSSLQDPTMTNSTVKYPESCFSAFHNYIVSTLQPPTIPSMLIVKMISKFYCEASVILVLPVQGNNCFVSLKDHVGL